MNEDSKTSDLNLILFNVIFYFNYVVQTEDLSPEINEKHIIVISNNAQFNCYARSSDFYSN